MKSLLPGTTRAQVTGHRFLRRRIHHGLVLGDVRMINDPLSRRTRAVIVGVVSTVLIAAGAGLCALIAPRPDPGAAPLMRTDEGVLYVRKDGLLHPVTNALSGRLILGEPAEIKAVDAAVLSDEPRGMPLGIPDPPEDVAEHSEQPHWAVCHVGEGTAVVAASQGELLKVEERPGRASPDASESQGSEESPRQGEALLLHDAEAEVDYVVDGEGKLPLPGEHSTVGRVVRRALGITAETPRWDSDPEVHAALREFGAVQLPRELPDLLRAAGRTWARLPDGVAELSPVSARVLVDLGAESTDVSPGRVAALPESSQHAPFAELPAEAPLFLRPAELLHPGMGESGMEAQQGMDETGSSSSGGVVRGICAAEAEQGGVLRLWRPSAGEGGSLVELSGGSVGSFAASHWKGAVAVDSRYGIHVVTPSGVRHVLGDDPHHTAEVIGVQHIHHAWWPALSLLPEGSELSRESALTPVTGRARGAVEIP